MKLRQMQEQKQILSQKQQQSVAILQMNAVELSDYIKEAALENPVMDIEERMPDTLWEEKLKKLEWMMSFEEQNKQPYSYDKEEDQTDAIAFVGEDNSETLAEHLHFQLLGKGFSPFQMEIFDFIAQMLDGRGYFLEDMAVVCANYGISMEEAEELLTVMKNLEPWGVCASSLEECLIKQLEMKAEDTSIERSIVEKYLGLLGKNQLHVIAKKLKISIEEVKEACEKIRKLNPKPGSSFGRKEMLRYIEPDVIITKVQDRLEILVNHSYPEFHLNVSYKNMMQEAYASDVKEYLKTKISQAENIRDAVSKREDTLLKVVRCILEVQGDFFLHDGGIKKLRLLDIAQKLEIHESTVSRAIRDKYLQCSRGLYPMKHFFVRSTYSKDRMDHGNSDETDSNKTDINETGSDGAPIDNAGGDSIRDMIQKIIREEDSKKPYSDQKITDILNGEGVNISRRTVTKYREAMNIPNGRERKVF